MLHNPPFFFSYLWESLRCMLLVQGRSASLQHVLWHLSWKQLVRQHSGLVQSINLEFNSKNVGIRILLLLLLFVCLFYDLFFQIKDAKTLGMKPP